MKTTHGLLLKAAIAAAAVSTFTAPALARDWQDDDRGWQEYHDQYRGDWDDRGYRDRDYDDGDVRLRGPGVSDLHPWFRNAKSGRIYAARRAGAYIDDREARVLNREYYDRFGWREARRRH